MTWLKGDCHVHSTRSQGGELTPAQVVAEARAAGLDFVAVTEHNQPMAYADWPATELLVIPGREVITPHGHWLEIGEDRPLRVAAHPHAPYPTGRFEHPLAEFDAVEVWNGPWHGDQPWSTDNEAALADWDRALRAGSRQPAIGNSDTHLTGQIGLPHTVVEAGSRTIGAILDGLRTGRSWLADSTGIRLSLTAPPDVRLTVEGVPSGTVTLHTDRGAGLIETLPADGPAVIEWRTDAAFVRAEVRRPDGRMAALTNPVDRPTAARWAGPAGPGHEAARRDQRGAAPQRPAAPDGSTVVEIDRAEEDHRRNFTGTSSDDRQCRLRASRSG